MKPIGRENYTIRPFKTFKRHNYSLNYLISQSESFSVYEAEKPPVNWTTTPDPLGDLNPNSIIFKRTLYASVLHDLYPPLSNTFQSRKPAEFDRRFEPRNFDFLYIIAINQQAFGEKVRPGTFRLSVGGGAEFISDDGFGRLLYNGGVNSVVGNIFYSVGLAVVSNSTAAPTTTTAAP